MRRFRFSLEAARQWRARLLEAERSRLEALFAELREIEGQRGGLERARREADALVLAAGVIEAHELAALDAHRRHVAAEKRRLVELARDCAARIAAQRESMLAAERKLRVLEKLAERRRAEWEQELSREQEALAAEAYIAGFVGPSGRGPASAGPKLKPG